MSFFREGALKAVRWAIQNTEELVDGLRAGISDDVFEGQDMTWGSSPDESIIDDRMYSGQFSSESEAQRWKRKADEYFSVIERIEKERDDLWSMYRTQVAEHLNAQTMLLKERVKLRQQLGRAVGMLNKMRKEKGLDLVKKPADLEVFDAQIDRLAEDYIEKMVRLSKTARDRLDEAKPKFTKK